MLRDAGWISSNNFISNLESESGAAVLQKLDEQLNKYRFMDANLQQKKKRWGVHPAMFDMTWSQHRLTTQIPDIKKTLDTLQFLKSRQVQFSKYSRAVWN